MIRINILQSRIKVAFGMVDAQPTPNDALRRVKLFMQLEKEEDRVRLLELVEQFVEARQTANLESKPSQNTVYDK